LKQEKRLDSNSFENIVDRKLKMHAYLFFDFYLNKKYFFSKICVFVFISDKNEKVKKLKKKSYKLICTL